MRCWSAHWETVRRGSGRIPSHHASSTASAPRNPNASSEVRLDGGEFVEMGVDMGFQQGLHQVRVDADFGRHLPGHPGGPSDPGIPLLPRQLEHQGGGPRPSTTSSLRRSTWMRAFWALATSWAVRAWAKVAPAALPPSNELPLPAAAEAGTAGAVSRWGVDAEVTGAATTGFGAEAARRPGSVWASQATSAFTGSMVPSASWGMRPVCTALRTAVWLTPRLRAYSRTDNPMIGFR